MSQVLNHTLTIERKGSGIVMFRPTIPIALETIEIPKFNQPQTSSSLDINLHFPGTTSRDCQSQGGLLRCRKQIHSFTYNERHKYTDLTNWYKIYTLTVFNTDDGKYYLPEQTKLVLRLETSDTNGRGDKVYSKVVLHDVHVRHIEWLSELVSE